MPAIPILLDCDPGHDDAIAMLLAAGNDAIDLRAVTTVAGNCSLELATLNARRVAALAGLEVPIAAGAAEPLHGELVTAPDIHGQTGLDGYELRTGAAALDPRNALELDPAVAASTTRRDVAAAIPGRFQAMPGAKISTDYPRADDVRELLGRHLAFARSNTAPEDVHALDVDALLEPAVTFYSFREDGTVLGVAALKRLDGGHAELKSMHTAEAARGRGIGREMVEHLIGVARDRGFCRVSLETGAGAAFAPARSLYARAGFMPSGPFGDYNPSRNSTFMTLALEPRGRGHTARMTASSPSAPFGVASMTAPLHRVLVRRPSIAGDWVGAGWRTPDGPLLARQHEAFCELLEQLGAQVEVAGALDGQVDSVYMHDPLLVTRRGGIPLRMRKPAREKESAHAREELERLEVPVLGELPEGAYADGGDRFWIDDATMAIGLGYRTNRAGANAVSEIAAREGVAVEAYDMPHDRGPGSVLHLQSFLSGVTEALCVIYEPLAPVRLLEDLRERAIDWIAIDEDSYEAMGCNILAVRPGVVVVVDGVPAVRRELEGRGIEVHSYDGSELSLKGDGGPTCLTAPLLRGP